MLVLDSVFKFDPSSKYGFIADYSGQISVLKLEPTGFEFVTTLKGHQSEYISLELADHPTSCYQISIGKITVWCLEYDHFKITIS